MPNYPLSFKPHEYTYPRILRAIVNYSPILSSQIFGKPSCSPSGPISPVCCEPDLVLEEPPPKFP